MSNPEGSPTQYWFDTRDGALLVGATAAEDRILEGGPDVVELRSFITAPDFPYQRRAFDRGDYLSWTNEDYITHGKWVLNLIQPEGCAEPVLPLKEEHISRLHYLGLGPHARTITKRPMFGGIGEFRRHIGSPVGRVTGRFDHLTHEQFVQEAALIGAQTGRRPTEEAFDRSSFLTWPRVAPNTWAVQKRYGSTGRLNGYLGIPHVKSWEREDYLDWGRRVLTANPGIQLKWDVLRVLAKRQRGPSDSAACRMFGSIKNFESEVDKYVVLHNEEQLRRELVKTEALESIAREPSFAQDVLTTLDAAQRYTYASMYSLLSNLLGDDRKACHIATLYAHNPTSDRYLKTLQAFYPRVGAGDLEATALSMGLFDIIWPMPEEDLSHLVV